MPKRIENPVERTCRICKEIKLIEEFPKQNTTRDDWFTYRHSCKKCESNRAAFRASLNHEKGKCYCGKERFENFTRCEQCKKKRDDWRQNHLEQKKKYEKKKAKEFKEIVFSHYGKFCFCCGEAREEFLTIDHIGGWGKDHRDKGGRRILGARLLAWIIKNNFPDSIRIACYNCNCSIGHKGYCPHEKERENVVKST